MMDPPPPLYPRIEDCSPPFLEGLFYDAPQFSFKYYKERYPTPWQYFSVLCLLLP